MSSKDKTKFDEVDEEVRQHIDMLHDRIQFLTKELDEAERTILELEQEGVTAVNDDQTVMVDLQDETPSSRLVRYSMYLSNHFDEDEETVSDLLEELLDYFDDYVDSSHDLHEASLALLVLFLKHEEAVR